MEPRKHSQDTKKSRIEKKLKTLVDSVKNLPDDRKEALKETLSEEVIQRAYSTKEVASKLGISNITVRRLIQAGKMKYFKIGPRIRIPSEELAPFEDWVTIDEAAQILGIAPLTVRRMIKRGDLKSTRAGARLHRIARADVEEIISKGLEASGRKEEDSEIE